MADPSSRARRLQFPNAPAAACGSGAATVVGLSLEIAVA